MSACGGKVGIDFILAGFATLNYASFPRRRESSGQMLLAIFLKRLLLPGSRRSNAKGRYPLDSRLRGNDEFLGGVRIRRA